jgi:hypothetical protein
MGSAVPAMSASRSQLVPIRDRSETREQLGQQILGATLKHLASESASSLVRLAVSEFKASFTRVAMERTMERTVETRLILDELTPGDAGQLLGACVAETTVWFVLHYGFAIPSG